MPAVRQEIAIDAPPERVWEALVDLPSWLTWNPHMREITSLSEGPLAVGSRARIVLRTGLSSKWEVTELTPGRSFTWVSRVLGAPITFGHEVEGADGGSRAILWVDPSGPLGTLAFPVLRFVYSRNLSRALSELKNVLEKAP
jgi:uncharacterized protein YndB with AHSA1/START domain